jgi:mevalonate kinase
MNHAQLVLMLISLFFTTHMTNSYAVDDPCPALAAKKKQNDDYLKQLADNINSIDQTTTLLNNSKAMIVNGIATYNNTYQTIAITQIAGQTLLDTTNTIKTNLPTIQNNVAKAQGMATNINVSVLGTLPQTSTALATGLVNLTALTLNGNIAQKHGASAKLSDADGGDCGIAVCTTQKQAAAIKKDWSKAGIVGIVPLNVKMV